jgi:hypothetical protein
VKPNTNLWEVLRLGLVNNVCEFIDEKKLCILGLHIEFQVVTMPWEIIYEMHFGGVKQWDHGRKDLVTSMMPGDTGLMMDLDFLSSFR